MGSSTHNDDHCHRQNKAVKEEDCSWGLYSGMPDILPSWSVGRLLGRRYTTGRCLWDGAKVKEFILWGPAARDCGIGGGWADWGQHQGGVHPGDECCPRLTSSNTYIRSHWCQMHLKALKPHARLMRGLHQPHVQVITERLSMISEGKVLFFYLKQKCKYFLNMCIKKGTKLQK